MMIEVERRSFLTRDQYSRLNTYFDHHAQLLSSDEQETHYLNSPADVRIQRSSTAAKIWLKKGVMHASQREEIEVPIDRAEFSQALALFAGLDMETTIIWYRQRKTYHWDGLTVMLDRTKGYGDILEIEKVVEPAEVEATLNLINQCFRELDIEVTPKEIFDERYAEYQKNWKKLLNMPDQFTD